MTFTDLYELMENSINELDEPEFNAQVIDFVQNEHNYYLFDQIEMNNFLSKVLELINDDKS